ncbi:MAG: family 43 glycosylhydrolase [Clostridia bacterium]|nr:family 43 glycosylhydrolase [Clostridia bacterium]
MKKIISILLSASVLLGLVACEPAVPDSDENSDVNEEANMEFIETKVYSPDENLTVFDAGYIGETFANPVISLQDENIWTAYGVGDPFVMRWNGKYYLYNSTKDWDVGIQCWTSDDLVNWTYMGLCATEALTMSAYAPEVTYYNGKFYMYTFPAGNGHYVLESTSPTGPFVAVTENFGLSIDGNVFIDDNGDWYFTSAGGDGINAYRMNSPTDVDASSVVCTNLMMQAGDEGTGWTEGSMLIKYGNKYYMTYCGNHVWSYGYRINYASGDSPLGLTEGKNCPILVNTDPKEVSGIGHSSTVLGPNLDSLYIVYHSSYVAPQREMNIAPIVLNGSYLQALGPTVNQQQIPEMPDIYSRFDSEESLVGWTVENATLSDESLVLSEGGKVLSEKGFSGDYTAEFNFLSISGKAGAVFSYYNSKNYGAAYINSETNELEIIFTVDDVETVHNIPLEASFGEKYDFSVLQQLSLRKSGSTYTFLVNNRTVFECESSLGSGTVGVEAVSGSAAIGFVGAEGNVWLSSMKEYFKPVKGSLLAITCMESSLDLKEYDGMNYVSVKGGQSYNYKVNVSDFAKYDLGIKYVSSEDVSYEFYHNGNLLCSNNMPSSGGSEATAVVRGISLPQGSGILTFKIIEGSADIFSYDFTEFGEVEPQKIDLATPVFSEGTWSSDNNVFNAGSAGKYLFGNDNWGDYTATVKFTPKYNVLIANLLFRASQAAVGGGNNDVELGTNFFLGYFVKVTRTNKQSTISLNKQTYNPTELASEIVEISKGESVEIKVEAYGSNIKVYLRGELVIDYTDPNPILNGAVGVMNVLSAEVSDLEISK